MTLRQFLTTIRRRWVYVLLPFLISCIAVGAISMLTTPLYTARASAYFSLRYGQTANELNQGASYTQQQIASYALLTDEPIVLEPVISQLGLNTTPRELARSVNARASVDSVIVEIAVENPRPAEAARIANAIVTQLGVTVRALSPKVNGNPSVEVTTVARATPPEFQSSPNTRLNVLIAALGGLLLGLLAALARQQLDTRIRTREDLPDYVGLLTTIDEDRDVRREPVRVLSTGTSRRQRMVHEAFRTLRTNLGFLDLDADVRVIVVTSSVANEGKTTISSNLAAVLAENERTVILVDGDLRRPKISQNLGIEGALGFVDALAGKVDLDEVIQPWAHEGLFVLPAGSTPPNPAGVLGSRAMKDLLQTLRLRYDYVIIDAPPLLPVTDAAVVAHLADGAILVARYGKTSRHQLAASMRSLSAAQAQILGAVINRATSHRPWMRRANYDYYLTDTGKELDRKWH